MNKILDDDDCPFTYKSGSEPVSPIHIVIGRCVHCFQLAYTVDINNNKSCFPCAYDSAN